MNSFTTTRYEGILLELCSCIIAYTMYELFKLTPNGKKYQRKYLMKKDEKEDRRIRLKEAICIVMGETYYGVYPIDEVIKRIIMCEDTIRSRYLALLEDDGC